MPTISNRPDQRHRRPGPGHNVPASSSAFVGWVDLGPKGGRTFYRSSIERDALIQLRMDRAVLRVERNDLTPIERIDFDLLGTTEGCVFALSGGRSYTPDLRVTLADGSLVFVEVGPHSAKAASDEAGKLEEAKVESNKIGVPLVVLTDRNMRGFRLENGRRLIGSLSPVSRDPLIAERVRMMLVQTSRTLDEVCAQLSSEDPALNVDLVAETFWAVVAEAAAADVLVFDLDGSRVDASSRFGIGEPNGSKSYFERVLDGSYVENDCWAPERAALEADVVFTSEIELSAEDLAIYQTRLALVRDKERDPSQTWVDLARKHGVTVGQARHYWKEYQSHGEAELRPHQRKFAGPRAPVAILDKFAELYRSSRTHRVKAIVQHEAMRSLGRELGFRFSYEQAKRYARELKKDPRIHALRSGKKRLPLPKASGPVDPLKEIEIPYEEVQVDATPVDAHTIAPDGKSLTQRLWLMTAVDRATRCLAAWRICEFDPSEVDFLALVQMAIRPKDALRAQVGAQLPYPVFGIPQRIVTDRGWSFLSKTVITRLSERGIVLQQAAPFRPEMKGVVERLFRTLNERFIHRIPATTKSDPKSRGGRDAVREAREHRLTVERFTRLFARAVIDGYSDEVHSRLGCTPLEKWDKAAAKWGRPRVWPSDPASQLALSALALKDGGTRERQHSGYEFRNAWFRPLRADAPDRGRLLYDPDDMRSVLVVDPVSGQACCEASLKGFDTSAPIDELTLAELTRPQPATGPRRGSEVLTQIVAEVEAGKPTSRRAASRQAKAVRAVQESARSRAASSSMPEMSLDGAPNSEEQEEIGEPVDLDLEPRPEYSE